MTARRVNIYVRPEDMDDYEWAKKQREKYSGCCALGIKLLRAQRRRGKTHPKKAMV
jgi:hypothetical protein